MGHQEGLDQIFRHHNKINNLIRSNWVWIHSRNGPNWIHVIYKMKHTPLSFQIFTSLSHSISYPNISVIESFCNLNKIGIIKFLNHLLIRLPVENISTFLRDIFCILFVLSCRSRWYVENACSTCGTTTCTASPVKQTGPLNRVDNEGRSYIDNFNSLSLVDWISSLKNNASFLCLSKRIFFHFSFIIASFSLIDSSGILASLHHTVFPDGMS